MTQAPAARTVRVVIHSDGWELIGDLQLPESVGPVPAVLLLNQAAGDRTPYRELAERLAERGLASLRLDLRGHGESTNHGRFEPGAIARDPLIWDSERDVIAAHAFLQNHQRIDGSKIGVVGASYSGEEMAEAGRLQGYAQAYVALSPGSFSDGSIRGMDESGVPWLFCASTAERFVPEIAASIQAESRTAELSLLPGSRHATDLLSAHPDLAERIAVWLRYKLL